ncbi:MAG: class I SAM-dependent methyltransferase, partial [Candidatus Poribacteria bacterium]|nr:class I SAM-dependent methyltransferase [Candidatus Poribacteria bacterium]
MRANMLERDDAFGQAVYNELHGDNEYEIIERDDGFIAVSAPVAAYFAPYAEWSPSMQRAMDFVRGRALDVGCGAGRVALHLQEQGHEVVGIDVSPLAVKTCLERGVTDARVCPIENTGAHLGVFDTIVMMGNNFGLFGNRVRARKLLRRFHAMTSTDGRIVAQSLDPYNTNDPLHRAY